MTQDEKAFVLRDLCARLPYGIKVKFEYVITSPAEIIGINKFFIECEDVSADIEDVKPYLFPLSSMTEEQKKEYDSIIYHNVELHWERYYDVIDVDCCEELYDFYNKNHLDYRGLIPMGLAIDATGLNIY